MSIYAGFNFLDSTTPPPWAPREITNWQDMADTVTKDTIQGQKDVLGHKHSRLYDSIGSIAIDSNSSASTVQIYQSVNIPAGKSFTINNVPVGGGGGGTIKGSGSTIPYSHLALFVDSTTIADSVIMDDGTNLYIQSGDSGGYVQIYGGTTYINSPIVQFGSFSGSGVKPLAVDNAGDLQFWTPPSSQADLTSTQVGFGNGSNKLTGLPTFTFAWGLGDLEIAGAQPEVGITMNGGSNGKSTFNMANDLGSSQNFEFVKFGSGYGGTLFGGGVTTPTNNTNFIHSQTGNMAIQVESDSTLMMGAHNKVQIWMTDSSVSFQCGAIKIVTLPTSPTGLEPGTLWNSGGIVCVV